MSIFGRVDSESAGSIPAGKRGARPLSNLGRWWRLAQKELRETLRDRRTMVTLILMPLLTYPLLGSVLQKLVIAEAPIGVNPEYRIVCEDEVALGSLQSVLNNSQALIASKKGLLATKQAADALRPENNKEVGQQESLPDVEQTEPLLEFYSLQTLPAELQGHGDTLEELVTSQLVELGCRRSTVTTATGATKQVFQLVYHQNSGLSQDAYFWVDERFRLMNEEFGRRLASQQNPPAELPAEQQVVTVGEAQRAAYSLSALVPMMLILMTVTGAVYPAIDLTAGERERGTLETLVAAPLPRLGILLAKYIAVVAVSVLTGAVNLLAMFVTVLATGADRALFGEQGITLSVMLLMLVMQTIFASFFASVLLAVTSFARSFKEAQAYLIPVMLVALTPGIASLMPGFKLEGVWLVVPLLNLVLLTRDVFAGEWSLPAIVVALGTSVVYTLGSLSLASRIFGTDAILTGTGEGSGLGQLRRSNPQPGPRLVAGWISLALLLPTFVVLSGLAGRWETASMEARLTLSSIITVGLFVGVPLVGIWLERAQVGASLAMHWPVVSGLVAAILFGVSLWPFAFELEQFTLPAERVEALIKMFGSFKLQLQETSLWVKLLALAVVPAICEELYFRGYLFTAFRGDTPTGLGEVAPLEKANRRWGPVPTIVATAVLFGAFHVLVRGSLFWERFLPSTGLGLVLGTLRARSGSVIPGIVMHVLHNSSVLLLAHFEKQILGTSFGQIHGEHLPWPILVGAGVLACGGVLWLVGTNDQRFARLKSGSA